MIDDLTLIKCLGKGSFGEVYLTNKKGHSQKYATKKIPKSMADAERYRKYFKNEITILQSINHKNIMKLIELKQTKDNLTTLQKNSQLYRTEQGKMTRLENNLKGTKNQLKTVEKNAEKAKTEITQLKNTYNTQLDDAANVIAAVPKMASGVERCGINRADIGARMNM